MKNKPDANDRDPLAAVLRDLLEVLECHVRQDRPGKLAKLGLLGKDVARFWWPD
jgi:hypothetical protein